jgi:hypothetical protein
LRLLYPAKLSFIIEGEKETFHDKQKLKQYLTIEPAYQQILKETLYTENEDKHSYQ